MKILVTGGAGFIGSNFVYYMLNVHPDYEIVCTGRSSTHIKALADELDFRTDFDVRTEGRDGVSWLLIDLGCVIVHIFARDAREFYKLERLLPEEGRIDITALTSPAVSQI